MISEGEAVTGLLAKHSKEQILHGRNFSRRRIIAGVIVVCGLVAGASLLGVMPSSNHASSGYVRELMVKSSLRAGATAHNETLKGAARSQTAGAVGECHWIKMAQHDFPERSDRQSVVYKNFKNLHEVKRFAEEGHYSGFAVRNGVAFMKGGDNGPRSWKDLVWMGLQYQVDFYLCEKTAVWRQTQKAVEEAMAVVDGYITRKTASVKDQWVIVHALPENEGAPMGFDNAQDVESIADFKTLCAAHPDCVGFAYDLLTHSFFAKKKWSGFDARFAKYSEKDGWEWHYIKSRGQDPANPTEIDMVVKKK